MTNPHGDEEAVDFHSVASPVDDDQQRRKSEADEHVANFVADQLHRVRTDESLGVFEDEFEAQLDN